MKRLYKELFDVINTNSLYEELKPLLKTIHLYIEGGIICMLLLL